MWAHFTSLRNRLKKKHIFYPHFVDEEGGSANVDKDFCVFVGLFKGSFDLSNAYLVVFGLFLPKTEEIKKNL